MRLTSREKALLVHAKKAIVKYNTMRQKNGGLNTLYAFLMSDSGKIYDGACVESNTAQATLCGERHAIANMIMHESYRARIQCIVIADPVPEVQARSTPPCGTCRHLISERGEPGTTVLCLQYIHDKKRWDFPKVEKYKIQELYPHPFEPKENLWK
jgi:cytidine deaminase